MAVVKPTLYFPTTAYTHQMLSRERIWQRISGKDLWPLAWALAAACVLPWLLPEDWAGHIEKPWIIGGWIAVALASLLIRHRRLAVLPIAAVLVWGTFGNLRQRALWEAQLPSDVQVLEGTIDAPWSPQGQQLISALEISSPPALKGNRWRLSIPWPSDEERLPPPLPGTPVWLRAELRPVDPAPRFLVERPLWRARSDRAPRRIHLASALQFEIMGAPKPSPLLRLQSFVRARFEALPLTDPIARDLWGALALGISPIHEETTSAFAESGTLHILIVSGLQVTLVMAAVQALLSRLLGRGGAVGAVAAGIAYAAVVGFSAPVWRGLFMGLAWAMGGASGWKLPPVLGLHLALLLWLLGHPAAGCEPGFLLAWWALLALLWCSEPLAGLVAPLLGKHALTAARFTAPWLATLPLLALFHGGVPLWGALANVFVLPLVALLTPVCLFLTLLPVPGMVQGIGILLTWTGGFLVPFFAHVTPMATAQLWPWILVIVGWLGLAHRQSQMRRTRAWMVALLTASAALLINGGIGHKATTLSLEAVDIGQGDALLLRVPDGDATLIDTGPAPWAARRIARALSRRGVTEPLHLIITHPHGDHAGGWATLSRLRPFASVMLPAIAGGEDSWIDFRPIGDATKGSLQRGDAWPIWKADVSVRWPPKPFELPDANMVSAVMRVRWQDRELWLMGDALQIQERDLMDLGEPGPEPFHRFLKVGHHGSRSSSAPEWVRLLSPDAAIVSAGRHNRFGHPHEETVETLRQESVAAFITGAERGVRMEVIHGGWKMESGDGHQTFTPFQAHPKPAAHQ
jgi:competence protein ComEC